LKFLPMLAVAVSVAGAVEITPGMKNTINRVDVGRQEIDELGGRLVQEGNQLFADGHYMEARDKYLAAIKAYDRFSSGAFVEKSEYCRKRISDCYYHQAEAAMQKADELAQVRDYDEAIKISKEALKYCEPGQKEALAKNIELYEKRRDSVADRESTTADHLIPNLKAQEYQIQVLMEQGRKLAKNGEYLRAVRKFQEVLLINPFNADALQCLRAINFRIGAIGKDKYEVAHRRMMGELEWKSANPYMPFAESSAQNLLDEGTVKVKKEEKGEALRRRLEEIVLPKVSLRSVSVGDAVEFIRTESVKYDPEKRGVNIVFLSSLPKKAELANNPGNGDAPANDGGVPGDGDQPNNENNNDNNLSDTNSLDETIDLEIANKNIVSVLDMLCERTRSPKMRYQIDENAVLISPENFELGGMMNEAIHIHLDEGTSDEELKNAMLSEGIEFRPGAGVSYFPNLGRVVIRNDRKNLEKMKAYFETKKGEEAMVQLQIKLIEMTQNDIDELAFNWQYAVNSNHSVINSRGDATRATIIQSSSNELLRYYVPDNHTTTSLQDSTLAYMWANSDGTKITANMFALDWADSQDVLASPRITALPGHTAKIEMVTIRYFPEDWETIDVDTVQGTIRNGSTITRASPQPNLEKEKALGPRFEIKPVIVKSGDDLLIRLGLNFPLETFADEWIIYDSTTNGGDNDGDYIQMPVFNIRNFNSDILIGDGDTIVLGGVGRDDTTTLNDKIPILGDLPFVGRLFQSKYSKASKNNLLIFITARLVKPDGSPYTPAKQIERGLPSFGRLE
jgi:type II secretory pathway component GspD/PulD (secretin)